MKIGRLLLRLTVGGIFFGHGTQKLFGWFGGHGLDGTAQFFEQIGLRPGRHHALAASAAESGGGALMLAGAATPVAASMLTASMLMAIHRVHLKNGPWSSNGGYEFNALLIAAALTLADDGPGPISVDGALGDRLHGPGWALAALLGGIAGAAGAHLYAESQPDQATSAEPAEAAAPASDAQSADQPEPVAQ
jgi:putative oxidoreductase